MMSGMCENCPRRHFDGELTEALTSEDALLKNGGQLALDVMGLAKCPGPSVHEDTEGEREFGHSDYYDCQHPTQALAQTILGATAHAVDRIPREVSAEVKAANPDEIGCGSPLIETGW